jgi:hypothetical protein
VKRKKDTPREEGNYIKNTKMRKGKVSLLDSIKTP